MPKPKQKGLIESMTDFLMGKKALESAAKQGGTSSKSTPAPAASDSKLSKETMEARKAGNAARNKKSASYLDIIRRKLGLP